MPRVWTSTKAGPLAGSGPWSKLISAISPAFQPRPGAMLTPRIRLVRPVNDGRGAHIWIAEHLGLATAVEVTFADRGSDGQRLNGQRSEGYGADHLSARIFEQQAQATASVSDPHLVHILEHGEVNGIAFLVTQLLEGKSLRRRLLHGPVSMSEVQTIVLQACDALAKAHSLGIIHGGLRPDCLFAVDVANQPFIEIAGFGAPAPSASEAAIKNPYASPEQLLLATGSDARSDLWALAVSVYELLTTTLPFEAPTPAGVTVAICNGQFALPSHYRADLPPGIDGWFAKALAKEPTHRHLNANELARSFVDALTVEAAAPVAVSPPLSPPLAALAAAAAPSAPLPGASFPPPFEAPAAYGDDSLEMEDDDGEQDEKTVKWDLPDEWSGQGVRGRRSIERAAPPPPSLTLASTPGAATLPRATAQYPAGIHGAAVTSGAAAPRTVPPRTVPPRMPSKAADAVNTVTSNTSPPSLLTADTVPPTLQPGLYLDSPYLASVASALAIPSPVASVERPPPSPFAARSFFASNKDLFSADKTWLAALAFAAGVAVTWFTYDPDAESDVLVADAAGERDGTANIRTVSVDDLPTVAGDDGKDGEGALPVILQPHQLPRVMDEAAEERPVAPPAPSARPSPVTPVQKVQALSPATASNTPKVAPAPRAKPADTRGDCSPPYYFDPQGIQRLKAECLGGSGVITGPYGAVLATNVAAKAAAPAPKQQPHEQQARASSNCSPPYYFDGKIRRLKLDCL